MGDLSSITTGVIFQMNWSTRWNQNLQTVKTSELRNKGDEKLEHFQKRSRRISKTAQDKVTQCCTETGNTAPQRGDLPLQPYEQPIIFSYSVDQDQNFFFWTLRSGFQFVFVALWFVSQSESELKDWNRAWTYPQAAIWLLKHYWNKHKIWIEFIFVFQIDFIGGFALDLYHFDSN